MEKAKLDFLKIYNDLSEEERRGLVIWIQNEVAQDNNNCRLKTAEVLLRAAGESIRNQIPHEAILESEKILLPEDQESTMVHVDAFLYDDEAIDELVDAGQFSRNYCKKCGSKNVAPLTFISHSASVPQVKYVIECLIPLSLDHLKFPKKDLNFLDVGSRFGPFLLGAALFSNCSGSISFASISGVEMQAELCQLQREVIEEYLEDGHKVSVYCSDIKDCSALICKSDIIVLHNVFQYFSSLDIQVSLWHHLFQSMQQSTLIITCPSLEESFDQLRVDIKVKYKKVLLTQDTMLKKKFNDRLKSLDLDLDNDELGDFHVYQKM